MKFKLLSAAAGLALAASASTAFAAGEAMMRETLRRRHPEAPDSEIEDRLCRWLAERPGAEAGDAVGRPGTWPRTRA